MRAGVRAGVRAGARRARILGGMMLAGALLVGGAHRVRGQSPPTPQGGSAAAGGPAGPGAVLPRRQLLEQQVRQRFEQIVRQRLQLTDDQMRQLRQTNQRFADQRRTLADHERAIRGEIRRELEPGVAADQAHVAALTDSLFAMQRQRLDVAQAEQKELAGYLTPVQRVRYYGLEEQLRRRTELIRQRRQQRQAQGQLLTP